jgi:hypothetical protein
MHPQRTLLWRGIQTFSADHCRLGQTEDGWRIDGIMLLPVDRRPAQVRYRVDCDADWATRAVNVTFAAGDEEQRLALTVDQSAWFVDGVVRNDLAGCVDIDLGGTPATNTLPIRRLDLARGEAREIVAAWVRFPGLTVEPLAQRYTRLDDRCYRYESVVDGVSVFTADLDVDDLGLVTHYPGGWVSMASA